MSTRKRVKGKHNAELEEVNRRTAEIKSQLSELFQMIKRDGITPESKAKKKAADAAFRAYRLWMKERTK